MGGGRIHQDWCPYKRTDWGKNTGGHSTLKAVSKSRREMQGEKLKLTTPGSWTSSPFNYEKKKKKDLSIKPTSVWYFGMATLAR